MRDYFPCKGQIEWVERRGASFSGKARTLGIGVDALHLSFEMSAGAMLFIR